jgi:hypothetical protein
MQKTARRQTTVRDAIKEKEVQTEALLEAGRRRRRQNAP